MGWKWGCQPCLSKESMLFVKSKPPLPTRSLRSLRAAARSIRSALCLHLAHPFVAAAEKRPVSCREAKGLVTEFWSPRFVTIQYSDCEAFSLHGLEVGLPSFQLPMFSKFVTHCRKKICSTCLFHVCLRQPEA